MFQTKQTTQGMFYMRESAKNCSDTADSSIFQCLLKLILKFLKVIKLMPHLVGLPNLTKIQTKNI